MEAHDRLRRSVVRFGVFELDLYSRELYKRGHRIKLQEQPFQLLAMLLENPGELVTRDELRQRLWTDETVVSFDDGLNAAIRRLRFALGDSAERPRFIETLPRRGYRFIGQVERDTGEDETAGGPHALPSDVTPPPLAPETGEADQLAQPPRGMTRSRWWIVAALAVMTVAAVLTVRFIGRTAPSKPVEATFIHLTKASGTEMNPTLSPDGKWLAYVAHDQGDQDIFLQRVGSDSTINLTSTSTADDYQPAFSRDGRFIAFRSERAGGGIFVMTPEGQGVRRVSDFGFDADWSPDGKELVVASEGVVNPLSRTSSSTLWRVNVATGARRRILDGDGVQPSWSPHGQRIAFWRTVQNGGQRDIASISIDGGAPVAITSDEAFDWGAVWSPDGKYVYFASDRGGSMNLWRIAVDEQTGRPRGSREAIMTPARWSGDVSISAAGRQIAFTSADPQSNIAAVAFNPHEERTTGAPAPVTRGTLSLIQPAISPDGQWIAYRSEAEQEDIYVSRIDGTGERKLTNDAAKDRGPSWSTDGKSIAFYSDRGGKYEAWMVGLDGRGLRQLTSSPQRAIFFPLWYGDDQRLIVNSTDGSFTVRLASAEPSATIESLAVFPERGRVFRASSVSRDGKWITGTRYTADGTRVPGVVVYSADERSYRVLTNFGSWPAFLSDGRRLVFSDKDRVYLGDRVSGTIRELFSVDGQIPFGLSVGPHDNAIYFALATRESDIWLLTLR